MGYNDLKVLNIMFTYNRNIIICQSKHIAKCGQDQVKDWRRAHYNLPRIQGSWVCLSENNKAPINTALQTPFQSLTHTWSGHRMTPSFPSLPSFFFHFSDSQRDGRGRVFFRITREVFSSPCRDKIFPPLPQSWKLCSVFAGEPCLYFESQPSAITETRTKEAEGITCLHLPSPALRTTNCEVQAMAVRRAQTLSNRQFP